MEERREMLCRLLDCYGAALSEKSRDVLESYYADDLSLAEIAENRGITRQGVHDALRRAETELLSLEAALGLCEKTGLLLQVAERLRALGGEAERLALEISAIVGAEREADGPGKDE